MIPANFPEPPSRSIQRESLIEGLIFELDKNPVVVVNGPSNVGKTTLLAQFYEMHKGQSLAVFLNVSSSWGYDFELVTEDLCNQAESLCDAIRRKGAAIDMEVPTGKWRTAAVALSKTASSSGHPIYIILDGLDEISSDEESKAKALYSLVPLGLNGLKFLISGQRARTYLNAANSKTHGEFSVTGFTHEEAVSYLEDLLPRSEASKLYPLSKLPGYYFGVRRILQNQGRLPEQPLSSITKVFEYEWEKIKHIDSVELLVAYVCFDKNQPTIETAAKFLNLRQGETESIISMVTFLEIRDREIHFKHDSIYQFCKSKISHLQKRTVDHLIDGFIRDSKSNESISQLPALFSQAGRYQELISYLDDHYILSAIRQRRAARFVQERATLGLKAAAKRENPEEIIRFGLHGANLDELYFDDHWESRIKAFVSLTEFSIAFDIARSFTQPEDRLQALSLIANDQKERNGRVDDSILEEIAREHSLLDKEHLGPRAYDIAADLVHIQPKLALDLIRTKSSPAGATAAAELERKQNSINPDVIETTEESTHNAIEILQNRIQDPALRSLSRLLHPSSKGKTGEEILMEVERMSSDEEKGYFLRLWLSENQQHGGREKVIRYAIRFGISSKNLSPTPGFFLDAVQAIDGLDCARELLAEIRTVAPLLKRMGPTVDYYRLALRMLEIEARRGEVASSVSYSSLYKEILSIEDPANRAVLFAEQTLMLQRLRESGCSFFNKQHFQDSENSLEAAITIVLERTADHYQALRGCIRRIARYDCARAHSIVSKINTEERRDRGYSDVVFNAIVNRTRSLDIAQVEQSFNNIKESSIREKCLLSVLGHLSFGQKRKSELYHIECLHNWCSTLASPSARAIALGHYFVCMAVISGKKADEQDALKSEIGKLASSIDGALDKIHTYHALTSLFSDYDKSAARGYLDSAEKARMSLFIKTSTVERCLFLNIKVTLRALSGLIRRKSYSDSEIDELISLIEKLPDLRHQTQLYAELAIRFYLGNDATNCRKIVSNHLAHITSNLSGLDKELREDIVILSAPANYGASAIACLASIEVENSNVKNASINAIVGMLISKRVPGEPYDGILVLDDKTSATDIREVLKLLEYLDDDRAICYYIKVIYQFLSQFRPRVTKGEKEEIVNKIAILVSAKLPSSYFKAHDGYRLLGDAYVLGLRGGKDSDWRPLIERARKVPNVSDRALIMSTFADIMGGKMLTTRRSLLVEALEETEKIPVAYDRGERVLLIAEIAKPLDRTIFNAAIQMVAGKSSAIDTDDRNIDLKKRAVDMLYAEDEKLANQLVSTLDDEPMRDIKVTLEKRIQFLTLQSRIGKKEFDGVDLSSAPDIPAIFWRNLKRLNSGQIDVPKFRQLVPIFSAIEGRRIEESYPILSFGIQSCVRNYEDTNEAFGLLARIFRVCLSSARLVVHCLSESKDIDCSIKFPTDDTNPSNTIIIGRGEKDRALQFISGKFANEAMDRIYIVDPYFTAKDLDLIELIRNIGSEASIHVMTGKRKIQGDYGNDGVAVAFREAWKNRYGDRDAGDVKIYVVGRKDSGEPPIHDRFILLNKIGIKMGGSWNGLGGEKQMDLSALGANETAQWRRQAENYMLYTHPNDAGIPLSYDIFSL